MRRHLRKLLLAASALAPFGIGLALANPLNGSVVAGSAAISGEGTANVQVTQDTFKAIINWQSFNIGNGETTSFIQPSVDAVTLNRVIGGIAALLVTALIPRNPKRAELRDARQAFAAIDGAAGALVQALRRGDRLRADRSVKT